MGIGDEIMVTGQVRELQRTDPRRVKIDYEGRHRWYEVWNNNPRIARWEEEGDFNIFSPRDGYKRPYIADKSKERWTWAAWQPPVGELYLTGTEERDGARGRNLVVLSPGLKSSASPNKAWPLDRWAKVAAAIAAKGRIAVQLGPSPTQTLPKAGFIQTPQFRSAAAVVKHARLLITHEGAMHHAAAAFGTPTIVLFGGYISPAVTGYEGQVSLFRASDEHPLGCGWRVPCAHCRDAMESITADEVISRAEELLAVR